MTDLPIVVGIIGGVASGKSEVANQLVHQGAARINADELGHILLSENSTVQAAVVELLGPTVLDESMNIDRKRIAALVFGRDELSRQRRAALESILHPAIRQSAEARLAALRNQATLPIVVLDAPLLIEAGWASLCNEIIFVDTPLALRQRLALDRGWSIDELERRESAQLSIVKKRAAATRIIVNNGDIGQLRAKVDELFRELRV